MAAGAARPDTTRKKEEEEAATAPGDVDEAMDVGRDSTTTGEKLSASSLVQRRKKGIILRKSSR